MPRGNARWAVCALMLSCAGLSGSNGCVIVIGDPPACGGANGDACPIGHYCRFDDGACGDNDGIGVCARMTDLCTLEFSPVCGCDGQTYSNACHAAGAGVSVRRVGECTMTGDFCGGIAGETCSDGQFCQFETGSCGTGDQSGECMPIPDACTEEFAPVCGCDGRTYSNECGAHRQGISVDSLGECAAEP